MTTHTLKTHHPILHHHHTIHLLRHMAFLTGHLGVFAFQLEPRFIVVKIRHRPTIKAVAAGAVGHAALFELAAMHVVVAVGAGGG